MLQARIENKNALYSKLSVTVIIFYSHKIQIKVVITKTMNIKKDLKIQQIQS